MPVAMRVREFAKTLDHTLLKPDATETGVRNHCREAAHYHFAAVCVLPCHVRLAARELRGTDVKVATVVSFPFGADETPAKAVAVHEAIQGGASELDAVMNISKFLSGEFAYVAEGLAVKASGGIRTLEEALGLLNAGASRLGASSVGIIREAEGGGLQE